jgi:hypothetical protein
MKEKGQGLSTENIFEEVALRKTNFKSSVYRPAPMLCDFQGK